MRRTSTKVLAATAAFTGLTAFGAVFGSGIAAADHGDDDFRFDDHGRIGVRFDDRFLDRGISVRECVWPVCVVVDDGRHGGRGRH